MVDLLDVQVVFGFFLEVFTRAFTITNMVFQANLKFPGLNVFFLECEAAGSNGEEAMNDFDECIH